MASCRQTLVHRDGGLLLQASRKALMTLTIHQSSQPSPGMHMFLLSTQKAVQASKSHCSFSKRLTYSHALGCNTIGSCLLPAETDLKTQVPGLVCIHADSCMVIGYYSNCIFWCRTPCPSLADSPSQQPSLLTPSICGSGVQAKRGPTTTPCVTCLHPTSESW